MSNPLLAIGARPEFAAVKPEHVTPALDVLLERATLALEACATDAVPSDYQSLSRALDVPVEALARAWGLVGHLQSVADTPELRAAQNENLPRVSAFFTRLAADERVYAKYKAVADSGHAQALDAARRKALANTLRDFELGGADLRGEARIRFAQIQGRLHAVRRRRAHGRRPRGRVPRDARRSGGRGARRPQADPAPALPAAAAAVRGRSRSPPRALHRQCAASQ
jgi:Zn-dependent oligopeptidase